MILENKLVISILIFYLVLQTTNLTLLPIFNDESIYLDWAWSYTHMSGHLYDSLLDAKQPLLIWIFGIFERLFSNPLFAGRLVSVIFGLITLLGIYFLTKKILGKNIGILASFLYSLTPIFVFFNRQALMEASLACIGVWSCFLLLKLIEKPINQTAIFLGITLGLGFFIKSTTLIFVLSATVILVCRILKDRDKNLFKLLLLCLTSGILTNILLFINPIFWQTFYLNNRYSYNLNQLLHFPLSSWLNNFLQTITIGFVLITPFIFILGVVGICALWKTKKTNSITFLSYFLLALLLEILLVKTQGQRYLVPFLPFLTITSAFILNYLWKRDIFGKTIFIISIFIPLIGSLILVLKPQKYILLTSKITPLANTEYIYGQTSGYGINETIQYIKNNSSNKIPSLVLFGLNAGNPENAIDLYSQKEPNLFPLHIDSKLFSNLSEYECFSSKYPVFLVTRNDQLLGLEKYFTLEKSFANPYSNYSVNIYTIKKNCQGKSLSLSSVYKKAIELEKSYK